MAIEKLIVSNFKGIEGESEFEIKPITVFIGANSSGKSSCLHAIASLAQTLKLGNSIPALILDDDYAQVHLGRFIEIAHSKNYAQAINIRVDVGDFQVNISKLVELSGNCFASYSFECDKKTEEIYLEAAQLSVGQFWVKFKKVKNQNKYVTTSSFTKKKLSSTRKTNFFFTVATPDKAIDYKDDWLHTYLAVEMIQQLVETTLRNTLYLGPFRQSPLRRYPFRGSTANEVGAQGEAAITMLASEFIQSKDKTHLNQINEWLTYLGLAKSVGVSRVGSSDLFDVSLTLVDDKQLPIADLGYGLSQVLPVLTQCSFADNNSTLLFEQPELHLHEGAARLLAGVFVETANKKKCKIILESHSKELVTELFKQINEGKLDVNDLVIYCVKREDGKSHYTKVGLTFDEGKVEASNEHPWFKVLE